MNEIEAIKVSICKASLEALNTQIDEVSKKDVCAGIFASITGDKHVTINVVGLPIAINTLADEIQKKVNEELSMSLGIRRESVDDILRRLGQKPEEHFKGARKESE